MAMSSPDDLEHRVSALEGEVRELRSQVQRSRQDAAAARVLAGGADRDVAEIRSEIRDFRNANNRVLEAMREDITDLRTELRSEAADVRDEMRTGFAAVRGALDATAAGQQQLARMLTTLIEQQDSP